MNFLFPRDIRTNRRINIIIAAVIACFLLTATACKKKEDVKSDPGPVIVHVSTVAAGTAENVLRFTGDVRAIRDIRLLSQVAEHIVDFKADKGSFVREGQVLAVIDNTLLARVVDQAEAGVAVARSNLRNVESEYGRTSRLFAEEAVSRQQYEARKTQYENAQSATRQAEAVLEQARKQYGNAFIRAPFEGIISNRYVELGDMVAPGTPVFSLIRIDTMRVMAQVSEREFAAVKIGQDARLKIASLPEKTFRGQIANKMPILDPVSRMASVEVHIPNPDRLLVPGMFGDLEIVIGRKDNVPLVPQSILQYRTSMGDSGAHLEEQMTRTAYVFIVKDGKAVRRDVVPGYQGNGMLEVVSGVKTGDVIVVRGQQALEDGKAVKVVDSPHKDKQGGDL
ncbi:MAG: efflux RND transporter periplasmic adaptor subunit [Deltaproteobacteria bacterium]|nr:efflux RND transporter periplasmic adaptor subunit [Deltaproteobacteria bacterium]